MERETLTVSKLNRPTLFLFEQESGIIKRNTTFHYKVVTKKVSKGKIPENQRSHEIFNLRDSSGNYSSGEDEMITQLRETFHIIGRKSKKVQMLMHLKRLVNNGNSTRVQDLKVHGSDCQKIRTEKRILSSLHVKPVLPPERAEMVKQFYSFDKISKIIPGTSNCFC
jgi:hypothetical protein